MSDLILCVRHGEKPVNAEHKHERVSPDDKDGPGFDVHGRENRHSLTVRGWQRAGGLAATYLCGQLGGPEVPKPVTFFVPQYLDEDAPSDESTSHRPYQTVVQLARKMRTWPQPLGPAKCITSLHRHITEQSGVVVVCWEHQQLVELAKLLAGKAAAPTKWRDEDFDVIWRFERTVASELYRLKELKQNLLGTDDR